MSTNSTKPKKPTRESDRAGRGAPEPESKSPRRRCAHCGQPFAVNPRLGRRHRFCSKPECAQASRRMAHKKWLRKNGGNSYFSGRENVERVRSWRQQHPQYWKRTSRHGGERAGAFLLSRKLAAVLRHFALQDTIDARLALEIGMISRLSGAALQDAIAREIRETMIRGYAILNGQPIRSSR